MPKRFAVLPVPNDLGKTKQGYPILSRCCAEDNSAITYFDPTLNKFVVSYSYLIDLDNLTGEDVYIQTFDTPEEATENMKICCGYYSPSAYGV
jgi:hypothetical protein